MLPYLWIHDFLREKMSILEKIGLNHDNTREKRTKFVKIKKFAQMIDKHSGYDIVVFVFII